MYRQSGKRSGSSNIVFPYRTKVQDLEKFYLQKTPIGQLNVKNPNTKYVDSYPKSFGTKENFYYKTSIQKGPNQGDPLYKHNVGQNSHGSACSAKGGCSAGLYNLLDPRFNLKEVIKQLILLEDHINQKMRRCFDCIRKHSFAIEGFLEEAITLDKERKFISLTNEILDKFKDYQIRLFRNPSDTEYFEIAQGLRVLRKRLMSIDEICNFN